LRDDAQSGGFGYGTDIGTTNALVVNLVPAVTALVDGMLIRVKIATGNTGATTLNLNGLGVQNVKGLGGQPLQGGELVLGGRAMMMWAATQSAWIVVYCQAGALAIAPAVNSLQAMQLGQATGRLMGAPQVFIASGTYTPTAGMVSCVIEVQGGGGGGAGITTPSAGNISLGAPGACGAYAVGRFLAASIGASQVVTIGAAGTVGAGAAGGTGGTSSVGALISSPGGAGGSLLNNQVSPVINGNGTSTSAPTGGSVYNTRGVTNGLSSSTSANFGWGGFGGATKFGNGGSGGVLNGNGGNALNFGCGGGGTCGASGSATLTGGAAQAGIIIVWEYT